MGPPRTALIALVASLLAAAALAAPAAAQVEDVIGCVNCDFDLVTVDWNGTARPGNVASGTFEIHNTGESRDSYTIRLETTDDDWAPESDPKKIDDLPAGKGIFASSENKASFAVALFIPERAAASASATIKIIVESENDDDLSKETTIQAQALQVYRWALDCTDQATVQKTKDTDIRLTATNTGNGPDRATVSFTPAQGFAIDGPRPFELDADSVGNQTIPVGVGLRAEDGPTTVRWDLRSGGDPEATAACTTTFDVTGGTDEEDDETENGESPAGSVVFIASLAALVVLMARRRPGLEA